MTKLQKGKGWCSQHSISISSQRFWQEVCLTTTRSKKPHSYIYKAGHSLKGSTGLSFHQCPLLLRDWDCPLLLAPLSAAQEEVQGQAQQQGPAVRRAKRVHSRGCLGGA